MGRFAEFCEFLLPDEGEETGHPRLPPAPRHNPALLSLVILVPTFIPPTLLPSRQLIYSDYPPPTSSALFHLPSPFLPFLLPSMHTPPKYGDYEAQRHWMEITLHLPPTLWYRNSTSNDLAWWGLDYPPLTAWQSRMHGWVMHRLCPNGVALGSSRGYESDYSSKALLRWTGLSTDLLVAMTTEFTQRLSLFPTPPFPPLFPHSPTPPLRTSPHPALFSMLTLHPTISKTLLRWTVLSTDLLISTFQLTLKFRLSLSYHPTHHAHAPHLPNSKTLLRWTVLSTDLLVFFPAALAFVCSPFLRRLSPAASRPASHHLWLLAMLLLQSGLLLIDHGHFQYNSISLGLSLGAATAVMSRHYLLGSALFSLAINHKHMALYFAPAFFAHLLGRYRLAPRSGSSRSLPPCCSPHAQVVPNIALKELMATWLALHAASALEAASLP
ncbi:unnamed protein product [Closterium sp. NIES-64]|nr:unnamed protein product [Closterium sp. NIES-64]